MLLLASHQATGKTPVARDGQSPVTGTDILHARYCATLGHAVGSSLMCP